VVSVVLALAGRCDTRETTRVGRMDVVGAFLVALGLASLTYALVEGAERGIGAIWWAIVAAVAGLVGFVVWELRAAEPLLPFGLFRRRNFAASNAATFLVYAALGAYLLFVPVFLQFLGYSPFQAGLFLTPGSIALVLLASRFGALADRRGPRLLLTVGPTLVGVGLLLLLPISGMSSFWMWMVPATVALSLGLAMLVAPITNTAIASAPQELAGVASGVNQTVARVGGLLAVAVVGLVVALVFDARTDDPDAQPLPTAQATQEVQDASLAGFRAGMLLAAGLAFGGAAVAALWISDAEALGRRRRPSGEHAFEA